MQETMNICFTANDKYTPFMSATIVSILKNSSDIVSKIYLDQSMQHRWKNYQQKYNYARPISWKDAILAVTSILSETSESLCN